MGNWGSIENTLKKHKLHKSMRVETPWDYLFYSYKATLPLTGNYRSDLDKLHHAVNVIIESKLIEVSEGKTDKKTEEEIIK
jgi:hypothetical protein